MIIQIGDVSCQVHFYIGKIGMERKDKPIHLKFIMLGTTNSGKTSLIHQYVFRQFLSYNESSISASFHSKSVQLHGKEVQVQMWDTAGQERYNALSRLYYRDADCCMLVYDVNLRRVSVRLRTGDRNWRRINGN